MADERLAEAEVWDDFVSEEERELLEFMLGARAVGAGDVEDADPAFRERLRQQLLRKLRSQSRPPKPRRKR